MTKEAFDVYNGVQTSLTDVVESIRRIGHEENASLPAAENTPGYVEAFFAVSRTEEGSPLPIGDYLDELAPQIPADAKLLRGLVDVVEEVAGSGALEVQIGGVTLQVVSTVQQYTISDLDAWRSASAQDIGFNVSTDTITAGAVRVRIEYLR